MKQTKFCATFLMGLLLVMSFVALSKIQAQDEFEKVEVLDHPRYTLNERFNIDAEFTFLPLDAYYKPLMIDVAGSYQFNNYFSWEAVRVGIPIYTHDTNLNSNIESAVHNNGGSPTLQLTTDDQMNNLNFKVASTAFFNLLYSKSNFFNKAVVYHYWQAGLGASYWDFAKSFRGNGTAQKAQKQYGADLVLRARFFLSENFMLNLRMAHTVGFNSKAPRNLIQLGVGGGFAF